MLLDTCTFVWLASEPGNLGEKARDVLDEPGAEIVLSDVSVWEICMKWQAGKLGLPEPPRVWIEDQRRVWNLARAPIEAEHLYRSTELPAHHRDPFDRILVAQAIAESFTIVTPDAAIRAYPVAVIW